MPPIAMAGIAAAGTAGNMAGGKKASGAANKIAQAQLKLQQDQFGLAKGQLGLGNAALAPSTDYWRALLSGNRAAAQQATGPYASMLGEAAQGGRTAIGALTPRGGEQNLALAQNYNQLANNVAHLYAGMQPLAAQGLASNAGTYMGSAAAFNPQAAAGSALQSYMQQQQMAQQGAQGFGGLLFRGLNKMRGSGAGGSNQGLPPFVVPTFPGISAGGGT